jgi:hypothetical protein
MPLKGRILPAAALASGLALSAATAHAAPVIVVGKHGTVVRNDPVVPPPSDPEPAGGVAAAGKPPPRAHRAVLRSLLLAERTRRISAATYRRYVRDYGKARSVRARLRGARRAQLSYVISSIEGIAVRKRLTSSRLGSVFLTLERNTEYWPHMRFPAAKDQLTFGDSQILFQYYPGHGLQIQQLSTFKKANLMHGACTGAVDAPCDKAGLQSLLDQEAKLAVRRSPGFIAWEYLFYFDGGSPPWISGMADATAIQAYGRAAKLLNRPQYLKTAQAALGAFDTYAPLGVRTTGFRGGTHYLQYSFAPRTYIFNAFTQSLIGLYDYWKVTGDTRAHAQFLRAEPELEGEIPFSDVGDWSLYNYRGPESDSNYHELLREVLQSMCARRLGDVYCTYAKRYRDDQTTPAELSFTGPQTASVGQTALVSFQLSKLSAVEISVSKGGKTAFHKIATFRRGQRGFAWKPKSAGTYDVRLGAKELRTGKGLRTRDSGTIDVE